MAKTHPTRARGARSQANLKRTAGPGRPKRTADEKEKDKQAQKMARKLLTDPRYLAGLQTRLFDGKCQPGVEVAIWHYAFGRPIEQVETKQIVPVRIQHEFTKE